jgi:hypothetical protein
MKAQPKYIKASVHIESLLAHLNQEHASSQDMAGGIRFETNPPVLLRAMGVNHFALRQTIVQIFFVVQYVILVLPYVVLFYEAYKEFANQQLQEHSLEITSLRVKIHETLEPTSCQEC